MSEVADVESTLLAALPKVRAFAISWCGRTALADDLVQQTLLKAWEKLDQFEPGTNMLAWLYTILRNEFYTAFRRQRHEVGDADGVLAGRLATAPAQEGRLYFLQFRDALDKLPDEQREALILVGASGLSYEEAAAICGCAVGTMKSRVNRARAKLAEVLTVPADAQAAADTADWDSAIEAIRTTVPSEGGDG
jgi:RNA polymerase sigma-70 factor (ECF subfamily)